MSGYPGDEYYAMNAESERRRAMTPDQPPSTEQALSDIRTRWEAVQVAARNGELDIWNKAHHAQWADIEVMLAELTRLRASVASLQEQMQEQDLARRGT